MHYKLKSTKLLLTLFFNIEFIFLLWFEKITPEVFSSLITILLLGYFSANVTTKLTKNKKV
jgi:hypothetical protein